MKKLIALIMVLIGIFGVTAAVSADSPLTSTNFSRAYYHVDIVNEASGRNTITSHMAAYLADENNPIDVKAAIINALSWNINGKNNAELYCEFIYGKPLEQLDVAALSGDQLFCIGYLLALDDYNDTNQAWEYLKMARNNLSDSLTVALVTYLVEMMTAVSYDWQGQLNQILADTGLNKDLTDDAIKVITDYMILGIDNPVNIPKTGAIPPEAVYGLGIIISAAGILSVRKRHIRHA